MSLERDPDVVVALVTAPDADTGARIARTLVEEGLVACVNLVSGLRSIYAWKGEICDDAEVLLVLKTRAEHIEALGERVPALHPYDTPELLVLGVDAGAGRYLDWVREVTSASR